jgi:glucose/arabinose dehydrogenase
LDVLRLSGLFISSGVGALLLAGCVGQQAPDASSQAIPAAEKVEISRVSRVLNPTQTAQGMTLPSGFSLNVFAEGLEAPRRIAIAPGATAQKYDVFVSESAAGRVRVLRESNGDGIADSRSTFTQGLNMPYGLAFWKNWLYIANTDQVVRFPYALGSTQADGSARPVATLTQGGYNNHWTRNLLFSRDGKQLFVSVGSSCNTCEEEDPQRAAISVMSPEGKGKKLFATGMRNPVGMAFRPGSSELWSVINERDNIGDDVPPDYLTKVRKNAFYGWPYAYTDINRTIHPDPTFGDKAPQKVKTTVAPDVPVQAHSAALGVAFYPTQQNAKVKGFPSEYRGDAFLAFHGSWNRSKRTGYKIVRVDFKNGKPQAVSDFVTGFLNGNDGVEGRPVDIQVAPDGSLLFSDDHGGKIWRVSYTAPAPTPKPGKRSVSQS